MAINKITYDTKVAINIDSTIPDINKCNASDLNEIKSVVNNNADEIPTKTSDLSNDSGYITKDVNDLTNYTKTSDLSSVATSGSYNDLIDKPTIPSISDSYGTSTTNGYSQNYINTNTLNPSGEASTSEEDVSSATFNNTLEAPMNIDLKGNTLQNGTPTPSSPIPINNVSGDNDIVVSDGESDTTTYNIDLPSGMELNKIGTYQDYFYKENDKWYLHKEIGKVVLNGTENYTSQQPTGFYRYGIILNEIKNSSALANNYTVMSDYFKKITFNDRNTDTSNTTYAICNDISGQGAIQFNVTDFSTANAFKTWLTTHNTTVNYILATPTNTEITYTPLIEQLNTIEQAQSKAGITNVNQVNNDVPFILDLSVFNDTYNGRYQSVLEMYKRLSN